MATDPPSADPTPRDADRTLAGTVALVTGGASGIGAATVARLHGADARICVVDVDLRAAASVAEAVDGLALEADVGDPAALESAVARCESELGGLDVVHLNAGVVTGHDDLVTIPDAAYRRIMRVNVDGVVFGVRAAVPALRRRGGGAIVATSSLAGIVPFALDPWYALTKHAVVGFVRSIAPLLEADGIRVACVNPGIVDTPLLGEEAKGMLREAGFPLLEATDVADAVLQAVASEGTGECWICQPGRPAERYRFRDVPGPRAAGGTGRVPPGVAEGDLPLAPR